MEVRILVFLAFTSLTVLVNTLLIFGLYKAFSGLTTKVESAASAFQPNSETREWLESLRMASEQALAVSQATKERMAEIEPALAKAQENFNRSLARADEELEKVATQIDESSQRVKDVVAKPAFSVMALAGKLTRIFGTMRAEDE